MKRDSSLDHRAPRAFLCHSASDKPAVRALYRRLCADGIAPWLDEEDLLPGQDWRVEIERAVVASDCLIVCLSRSSLRPNGFMRREMAFALDLARRPNQRPIVIVPLRFEACDVPAELQRWHWVDLFEEHGYGRLLRGLRAMAADPARWHGTTRRQDARGDS